jgi:hypothetical protein
MLDKFGSFEPQFYYANFLYKDERRSRYDFSLHNLFNVNKVLVFFLFDLLFWVSFEMFVAICVYVLFCAMFVSWHRVGHQSSSAQVHVSFTLNIK